MAGFRIEGNTSGNVAEVDSTNNIKVNLPTTIAQAGYAVLAGEINSGASFGSREIVPVTISENNRIGVGLDSVVFNDSFNYTAQNTTNYRYPVTTQTVTHSNGYVVLNGSGITSINTNSAIQTYRSFPIFGGFGLAARVSAVHTVVPQANAVTEWGLFTASLPGAAIPTDGAYFRFTSSGEFRCVINYNGTEASSAALSIPSTNINHSYTILVTEETVIFYVDKAVVYDVDTPDAFSQPFAQGSVPFTARQYIAGSAPALSMQFKMGALDINLEDMNTTKPWAHAMSGQGMNAYQGQNGGTLGTTALYTNSLAPGAGAAATNTTAALGSGFGGQFSVQPTLAANTDGIISSYQNPTGSVTQTSRTLLISGVKIDGIVTTLFIGGPVLYAFSLAFGSTAVSLATAESATAKAPRRIPLGVQSYAVTSAVGVVGQSISVHFDTPVAIYPGEFVQVVGKNVGTVTSAGVIALLVSFDAYNE